MELASPTLLAPCRSAHVPGPLGKQGSKLQIDSALLWYFYCTVTERHRNRGLKRVSIINNTENNRANDVSRNPSKFQGIARPWFQTTKWAGGGLVPCRKTVRCGLAVVGVSTRTRGRDPPPARRFIDMAYLVAGQQDLSTSAGASNQQPPSSPSSRPSCCTGRVACLSVCLVTTKPICRPVLFVSFSSSISESLQSASRPLGIHSSYPSVCAVLCCVLYPLSRLTRSSPAPPFVLYEYIRSNEPRSNTASPASSALSFQCKQWKQRSNCLP